jgi:hypothetical protein
VYHWEGGVKGGGGGGGGGVNLDILHFRLKVCQPRYSPFQIEGLQIDNHKGRRVCVQGI